MNISTVVVVFSVESQRIFEVVMYAVRVGFGLFEVGQQRGWLVSGIQRQQVIVNGLFSFVQYVYVEFYVADGLVYLLGFVVLVIVYQGRDELSGIQSVVQFNLGVYQLAGDVTDEDGREFVEELRVTMAGKYGKGFFVGFMLVVVCYYSFIVLYDYSKVYYVFRVFMVGEQFVDGGSVGEELFFVAGVVEESTEAFSCFSVEVQGFRIILQSFESVQVEFRELGGKQRGLGTFGWF